VGTPLGFDTTIFRWNRNNIPLPKDQRSAEEWLNVNAASNATPGNALGSNIRSSFPSCFAGIRADGTNNADASFFKNFRLTERTQTQCRMDQRHRPHARFV
jgi:hypothetical protein